MHLFLTLALAVACVALAWAWWDAHRRLRTVETRLSLFFSGNITTGVVTDATLADGAGEDGVIVHFPSWIPEPPGPQIDHLGRELP